MTKPFYPRLEKDAFIDEIRITTVPRFKTSGLSGDEWRTSVEAVALRKGREVGRKSWNRLEDLLARLGPWIHDELLCPIADPGLADDLCFQPGCDQPGTIEYRIVIAGCSSCGHRREETPPPYDYRRRFCPRHANRGDASRVDSNNNYGPVDGGQPPAEQVVRPDDQSPSAFGGIVGMHGGFR